MPRPLGSKNKPGHRAGKPKGTPNPNAGPKPKEIDPELIEQVIKLREEGKSKHQITLETQLSYFLITKILSH